MTQLPQEFTPSDYQSALAAWNDLSLTWEYTGRKYNDVFIDALTRCAQTAQSVDMKDLDEAIEYIENKEGIRANLLNLTISVISPNEHFNYIGPFTKESVPFVMRKLGFSNVTSKTGEKP